MVVLSIKSLRVLARAAVLRNVASAMESQPEKQSLEMSANPSWRPLTKLRIWLLLVNSWPARLLRPASLATRLLKTTASSFSTLVKCWGG
jgi:hypothetical protein